MIKPLYATATKSSGRQNRELQSWDTIQTYVYFEYDTWKKKNCHYNFVTDIIIVVNVLTLEQIFSTLLNHLYYI